MTQIVLPHSGYKKLIAYKKSEAIYQGTVLFCRRFLPAHGDRTVDQMVQAARSCKQNIVEGSSASGTSKETHAHRRRNTILPKCGTIPSSRNPRRKNANKNEA